MRTVCLLSVHTACVFLTAWPSTKGHYANLKGYQPLLQVGSRARSTEPTLTTTTSLWDVLPNTAKSRPHLWFGRPQAREEAAPAPAFQSRRLRHEREPQRTAESECSPHSDTLSVRSTMVIDGPTGVPEKDCHQVELHLPHEVHAVVSTTGESRGICWDSLQPSMEVEWPTGHR